MAGTLPPLFEITDDDHGGYVAVAAYTLLVLMIGVVVTRVFTRWYIVRSIKADDYFLMAAAAFALVQTIVIQNALDKGLGRRREIINDADFESYQKYDYAAQMLSLTAIALSKISSAVLVQSLLAEGSSILAGRGLMMVITTWWFSSIFALAFQCALPAPWDFQGKCLNQTALHIVISTINISTDLLLVLLPCIVVWKVNLTSSGRRYSILALFATRLFVCAVTAVEIRYNTAYNESTDKTWSNTDATIWEQIMMNFSIIFTAIPSIGRLLVELQPAVNAFAITELHGARNHRDRWALSSLAGRFQQDYVVNNRLGVHTSVLGSRTSRRSRRNGDGGGGKQQQKNEEEEQSDSVRGLKEGVIKQTFDFRMS